MTAEGVHCQGGPAGALLGRLPSAPHSRGYVTRMSPDPLKCICSFLGQVTGDQSPSGGAAPDSGALPKRRAGASGVAEEGGLWAQTGSGHGTRQGPLCSCWQVWTHGRCLSRKGSGALGCPQAPQPLATWAILMAQVLPCLPLSQPVASPALGDEDATQRSEPPLRQVSAPRPQPAGCPHLPRHSQLTSEAQQWEVRGHRAGSLGGHAGP